LKKVLAFFHPKGYFCAVNQHQHNMTISEAREEKAKMSGDHKAWIKGKKIEAFQAARKCYLQAHPEVGTLIRNGKELFYVNLQPYHLGKTREFTPQSVIKIG